VSFYETRGLLRISLKQVTALCSKCGAAKQMNTRAAQRIKMVNVHGMLWCPPYFYSILFYFNLILRDNMHSMYSIHAKNRNVYRIMV
jgi:hypothetical protein